MRAILLSTVGAAALLRCSMSQEGAEPAAAAESLGEEIVADGKAFIQRVETDVVQDAEDAYAWLKKEYAALSPEILADLKTAVGAAVTEALSGGGTGAIVADALTILARDGAAILAQVKSEVVTATVGLTAAPVAG